MNTWKSVAAAPALALGLSAAIASASPVGNEFGPNLVTNGGFETGDFTGWTLGGNTGFTRVDCGGITRPVDFDPHSGSCDLLGGAGGTPNILSQGIPTIAGGHYNIHVWVISGGFFPSQFEIGWGGATVYSQTNVPNIPWLEIVVDPVASTTSTTLEIRTRNDPNWLGVDDISVRQVSAQAPEPATLALLGLGLAALGLGRRAFRT